VFSQSFRIQPLHSRDGPETGNGSHGPETFRIGIYFITAAQRNLSEGYQELETLAPRIARNSRQQKQQKEGSILVKKNAVFLLSE